MSKNRNRKSIKQTLLTIGLVALAVVLLLASLAWIGKLSNGFTDLNPGNWTVSDRNEANLIPVADLEAVYSEGQGFTVVVDEEDGTVKLSGSNKSDVNAQTVSLGKVTLKAGTYTFTTGKDGKNGTAGAYTYHVLLVEQLSETSEATPRQFVADYGTGLGFTLESEATFEIQIYIPAEEDVDGVKLYPAIYEGDEPQAFFVLK